MDMPAELIIAFSIMLPVPADSFQLVLETK